MRTFLYALVTFSALIARSQHVVPEIPDSLMKNSNEVIISDETFFTVKSIESSTLTNKYTALILNKYAEDRNHIVLYYDSFSEISGVTVTVFDINGKKKESFGIKDFQDWNAGGSNMASDSRAKVLKIINSNYPYFVKAEYSINYKGSLFYPKWQPQSDEKQALLSASLVVESFLDSPVRYKSFNVGEPEINATDKHFKATWKIKNVPAFEYESFSYNSETYSPTVYLAASDFQMDGVTGNMSSWVSFGEWIAKLNNGRNTLNNTDIEALRSSVSSHKSKLEKIREVYKYLQQNTRYVSIQLGLGGWQPFESGVVHATKYGDCKALTYYTKSILESVGVESYYTLIRAGQNAANIQSDFPNAHFNHAILTVPLERDTIWLECTSQTTPFGYMGKFTSDRDALMITENGGKLIHTKRYQADENVLATFSQLKLEKSGRADLEVRREYRGLEIEFNNFDYTVQMPASEQKKWFVDHHAWGNLSLQSLEISDITYEEVPVGRMAVKASLDNAARSSGSRMFFTPFVFTNLSSLRLADKTRQHPIDIRFPYTQVDTVKVDFPEVFFPERPMSNKELKTKFGTYERTVVQDQYKFLFIRKFILEKGTYPADDYDSFKQFIREVQRHDREQLVLIDKT